ncbi:hypothetical protein K2X33_05210, partial [bacterium]|nr:hypothetical protein [bacterium]
MGLSGKFSVRTITVLAAVFALPVFAGNRLPVKSETGPKKPVFSSKLDFQFCRAALVGATPAATLHDGIATNMVRERISGIRAALQRGEPSNAFFAPLGLGDFPTALNILPLTHALDAVEMLLDFESRVYVRWVHALNLDEAAYEWNQESAALFEEIREETHRSLENSGQL